MLREQVTKFWNCRGVFDSAVEAAKSELQELDEKTIANALENRKLVEVHKQSRLEGVMSPKIRCIFPEMGIMNGYAATAVIQATWPPQSWPTR